ncbi:NADH dehydrogenase [Flavobacteriaceae bacterium UJ101]|nr:NADH dehydrogenase [Flavobacteriaceae bacterium UJ101]
MEKKVYIPESKYPRIVVVGAGFAGIHFIKKLKNKPYQIVLLDENNFHQFPPLFYQVATSGLEPDSIVFSIRKVFQNYKNFVFRMAKVKQIVQEQNCLHTDIGIIDYDHLVIATGSTNNFYGMSDVEENSIGLKTIQESLDIRSHILQNLEKAVNTSDLEEKQQHSTIIIVGGGPAGVEMAGSIAEFHRFIYKKDYPDLHLNPLKIYLIEAGGKLLSAMTDKSSKDTLKDLEKLDVKVLLNTAVESYDGERVVLSDKQNFKSSTLIWTAGVKGQFPEGIQPDIVQRGNRLKVNGFNRIENTKNIYAIGDVAYMETETYPNGHPMVAPAAIQQGEHLADNFLNNFKKEFKYFDKGSLATIGKKKAVADLKNMHFNGFFAWLIWSTVHLMSISGFKNKLRVGLNWMNSYFSYDKNNRLIIRKYKR